MVTVATLQEFAQFALTSGIAVWPGGRGWVGTLTCLDVEWIESDLRSVPGMYAAHPWFLYHLRRRTALYEMLSDEILCLAIASGADPWADRINPRAACGCGCQGVQPADAESRTARDP